ncbi:MAG TPA: MFS transporter, partial [Chloroflexota bacterium]
MVRWQWTVLRSHPEFFKLWGGQMISSFGSAITGLALPLTAVVVLRATPLQMGLLGTVGFLPQLLFSLPAGVWVDRLPRRPILIGSDLGRAVLLGSIPVLALLGLLRMEELYVVAFLTGVCAMCFDVAALALVPALVERERLVDANSSSALSDSVAMTAGPALAGGIIQLLTAPVAIAIDALSFLLSAAFTIVIRVREPAPVAKRRRGRLWTDIGEGLRLLVAHNALRAMVVSATLGSFA